MSHRQEETRDRHTDEKRQGTGPPTRREATNNLASSFLGEDAWGAFERTGDRKANSRAGSEAGGGGLSNAHQAKVCMRSNDTNVNTSES